VFGIPTTPEGIASYTLLPPTARAELESRRRGAVAAAHRGDESVADFFTRHFGPETVGLIAEPLLGGIHAGDITKLSIDAVAPVFAARVRAGQLFAPATPSARPDDGLFKALRGGMGALVSAIERRLPAGSVHLSSAARALARRGSAWRVDGDGGAVEATAVVLACPAYAAAALAQPIDAELATLCAGVPYASTVSVALVWPRASVQHPLAGSGFVVARRHSDVRITACTWVSSKWEDRASPGDVLLRAFLGGIPDPEAVTLADAELVDVAVRNLAGVLQISGPPRTARVYRWIRAGAQHNVGHLQRVTGIDARLGAHPGLFVAGSGFRSIGVPDCVADGRAVARRVAGYLGLRSE
jgi:oxygen-dependent protoporphyrinogen oxidase